MAWEETAGKVDVAKFVVYYLFAVIVAKSSTMLPEAESESESESEASILWMALSVALLFRRCFDVSDLETPALHVAWYATTPSPSSFSHPLLCRHLLRLFCGCHNTV